MNQKKAKALRKEIYGKDAYTGPTGRVYAITNKVNGKTSGKSPIFFQTNTKTSTGKRRLYQDAKKRLAC